MMLWIKEEIFISLRCQFVNFFFTVKVDTRNWAFRKIFMLTLSFNFIKIKKTIV